jgi:hypothetical protein
VEAAAEEATLDTKSQNIEFFFLVNIELLILRIVVRFIHFNKIAFDLN